MSPVLGSKNENLWEPLSPAHGVDIGVGEGSLIEEWSIVKILQRWVEG